MSRTRLRRLGFERLEDRLVYSAAVANLSDAAALPPAPALAPVAEPSAAGGHVSPAAGGSGQFEGRKTIAYVSGSFGANQAEALSTLYVIQDQEFHFVLTAAEWGLPSSGGVDMSIRDAAGRPVFSMSAAAGTTRADEGYLDAGAYTVAFARDAAGPSGLLRFELGGVTLPLADTTQDPDEGSSSSTLAEYAFYWLPPHSVPLGIVVQQPPASLSLTSPDNGSATAVLHLLVSTPAGAVESSSSTAYSGSVAPPAAGTSGTGFPSAAGTPADSEPTAVSELLGISATAPPPADDHSAAPLPPQAPGGANTSLVGNSLLRELSTARAAAAAEHTVAATAAAEPLDASSVAIPASKSSLTAESSGLLWQWLAVVNQNLTVSHTLAPVVAALGWFTWQARASRKRLGEAECDFPSVDLAAHPLRSLAQ
jgi:hypothetical protein